MMAEPVPREPDPAGLDAAHTRFLKDPSSAIDEFVRLSKAGSLWSHIYLGRIYQYGLGKPVDFSLAEFHYRSAYSAGLKEGLYRLGRLYFDRRNFEASRELFSQGAEKGYLSSIYWLALSLERMPGDHRDDVISLVERAAARGHIYALRKLFNILKNPAGKEFSPLRAVWVYLRLLVTSPSIIFRDDGYDERAR